MAAETVDLGWTMPTGFRAYLLGEQRTWWRVGRRVSQGPAQYDGLRLTVSASQGAGLAPEFVEHLEQAWTEQRVSETLTAEALRYRQVRDAMRRVAADRPDEVEALELMAVPAARRRRGAAVALASRLGIHPETLMRVAERGARLVWDEMGAVW